MREPADENEDGGVKDRRTMGKRQPAALPWMRSPVALDASTAVPLAHVRGLHAHLIRGLEAGARRTWLVSSLYPHACCAKRKHKPGVAWSLLLHTSAESSAPQGDNALRRHCRIGLIVCAYAFCTEGYKELFAVQAAVWQLTAGGASTAHDLCISAPTGSGKTLAYALPILAALQRYAALRSPHSRQQNASEVPLSSHMGFVTPQPETLRHVCGRCYLQHVSCEEYVDATRSACHSIS